MIQTSFGRFRKLGALRLAVALGFAVLVFSGSSTSHRLKAAEDKNATPPTAEKKQPKTVEVPLLDGKQFTETLNRFKGKVVVVNLWATWCVPCRQEFPLLVKLYKQFKSQGVELVAISHDDVQNLDDVKEFVVKRQVPFATFLADPKDGDGLREAIYPNWTGALPSTFFFDRSGTLKARFIGTRTPEEFESTIKSLLSPGTSAAESPVVK